MFRLRTSMKYSRKSAMTKVLSRQHLKNLRVENNESRILHKLLVV